MSEFRYPQFCPLARAAEILGERWTLLVIRELLLGPIRFSELRRRLSQVSPSVLSSRVQSLEAHGLVERRELPPPTSAAVIQLTPLGQSLRPVATALTRFGIQLLGPPEPDDQFEPSWLRLGLPAVRRVSPTPDVTFGLTIEDNLEDIVLEVRGGPTGTHIRDVPDGVMPDVDVRIRAEGTVVLAMASGRLEPRDALASGRAEIAGPDAMVAQFPQLFDFGDAMRVDPSSAHSPHPQ